MFLKISQISQEDIYEVADSQAILKNICEPLLLILELGQLIEYYIRHSCPEKLFRKCALEATSAHLSSSNKQPKTANPSKKLFLDKIFYEWDHQKTSKNKT